MKTYTVWRWLGHRLRGHQRHAIKAGNGIPCWQCSCGTTWQLDAITALFIDLALWGHDHCEFPNAAPGWRWKCPVCQRHWIASEAGPLDIKWCAVSHDHQS